MHPLIFVERVVRWRWAPCAGLVAGSLAFVVLSVGLIPHELGPAGPRAAGVLGRSAEENDVGSDGIADDVGATGGRLARRAQAESVLPAPPQSGSNNGVVRSIFNSAPPMELPVAPPDPAPPPPPPDPPAPAPDSTIFTLPNPPAPSPPSPAGVTAPAAPADDNPVPQSASLHGPEQSDGQTE
jgi:hypothetical protein